MPHDATRIGYRYEIIFPEIGPKNPRGVRRSRDLGSRILESLINPDADNSPSRIPRAGKFLEKVRARLLTYR